MEWQHWSGLVDQGWQAAPWRPMVVRRAKLKNRLGNR
jgi:hypothetical protein